MPRIELIYFEGCPNANDARENLRAALVAEGLPPIWAEWNQLAAEVPEHALRYGSPTVLVNSRDVTGADAGAMGAACSADGAPAVETIRLALAD